MIFKRIFLPVMFLILAANARAEIVAATSQSTPAFELCISRKADEHSIFYPVKPGDNLTKIARTHHVTADLLKMVNGVQDNQLRPGDKLKIPTYKFSAIVSKSKNTLTLKGDDQVLKTYRVSTGSNNSTPVGTFKITDKLVNPTWYQNNKAIAPGSPENQLGTRWLGISKKSYGIHGTLEPEKLGQQVTAGCVRMKNEDVEELYRIVAPGTEVIITD